MTCVCVAAVAHVGCLSSRHCVCDFDAEVVRAHRKHAQHACVAVGRRFVHATGTQGGQKDRFQVLRVSLFYCKHECVHDLRVMVHADPK